jgi:hypothetical protein
MCIPHQAVVGGQITSFLADRLARCSPAWPAPGMGRLALPEQRLAASTTARAGYLVIVNYTCSYFVAFLLDGMGDEGAGDSEPGEPTERWITYRVVKRLLNNNTKSAKGQVGAGSVFVGQRPPVRCVWEQEFDGGASPSPGADQGWGAERTFAPWFGVGHGARGPHPHPCPLPHGWGYGGAGAQPQRPVAPPLLLAGEGAGGEGSGRPGAPGEIPTPVRALIPVLRSQRERGGWEA